MQVSSVLMTHLVGAALLMSVGLVGAAEPVNNLPTAQPSVAGEAQAPTQATSTTTISTIEDLQRQIVVLKSQLELFKLKSDIQAAKAKSEVVSPQSSMYPPINNMTLPPMNAGAIQDLPQNKKSKNLPIVEAILGGKDHLEAIIKMDNGSYRHVHANEEIDSTYKIVSIDQQGVLIRNIESKNVCHGKGKKQTCADESVLGQQSTLDFDNGAIINKTQGVTATPMNNPFLH